MSVYTEIDEDWDCYRVAFLIFISLSYRPGWLSRAIDWTVHAVTTAEFYRDANKQGNARGTSSLARSYLDDVALMFQKMRIVYATLDNDNEEEFELQVSCLSA